MGKLLLLFILVPAAELALLIEIGSRIGTLATIGVIVVTGALGALLARRQGMGVVRRMQSEVGSGQLPAHSIVDGVIILVAAALLMTPGFLTDVVGFASLIPASRAVITRFVWRRVERAVQQGAVAVYTIDRGPS